MTEPYNSKSSKLDYMNNSSLEYVNRNMTINILQIIQYEMEQLKINGYGIKDNDINTFYSWLNN